MSEQTKPVPSYNQVTERIFLSSVGAFAVMLGVATLITAVKSKD